MIRYKVAKFYQVLCSFKGDKEQAHFYCVENHMLPDPKFHWPDWQAAVKLYEENKGSMWALGGK